MYGRKTPNTSYTRSTASIHSAGRYFQHQKLNVIQTEIKGIFFQIIIEFTFTKNAFYEIRENTVVSKTNFAQ